ncbi:MAG: HAMP domain-containing protein [Phycisphaerae bacterium]|nr:HAMP domain-containing protein [Phycisphaerae bacterium]
MRSLFLKVFLWFWLASTLTSIVYVYSAIWMRSGGLYQGWVGLTTDVLNLSGDAVEEKLAKGGKEAVAAYLDAIAGAGEVSGYLLDDQGNEVRGVDVTPRIRELAAQALETGERQMALRGRTALAARRAVDPAGDRFVFVSESPGFGRRPYSMEAEARLVRAGATFLAMGVVCYWLVRYIASPVRKLRTATRQLADGDLSVRVGKVVGRRRDEIGDLARDFDYMAERVESLLAAQRTLLRDISHELRSPLARLSVALELARKRSGPEAVGALERIERESGRLNDLIGQLLALTRLETGAEGLQAVPVDLAEVLDDAVENADFEARNRGRRVRVLQSEHCSVLGQWDLLHSAIENVLRNAVLYTAKDTEVEVTLACEGGVSEGDRQALIRVRDHGEGIPEDALAEVFRPFHRVGEARDRQTGGTGLGLAITQRAVNVHGGTVKATNAPDGGLIVEIRLPLADEATT